MNLFVTRRDATFSVLITSQNIDFGENVSVFNRVWEEFMKASECEETVPLSASERVAPRTLTMKKISDTKRF